MFLRSLNFDIVFHLAAYNHVGDSFKHGLENVNSNLIINNEFIRSWSKVLKNLFTWVHQKYMEYKKNYLLILSEKPNPMSPYGVTKYASELFALLEIKTH